MVKGRPTKYKAEYAKQAKKLCNLGATDMQLADFFGVSVSTVQLWKIKNKVFSDSIRLGKESPNDMVERSLFNRAIGYSHEDVDIRVVNGEVVETPIIKHYPPDTTAATFFLKNRKPKEYKDKITVDDNRDVKPISINIINPN